jgi:hypothetical protein
MPPAESRKCGARSTPACRVNYHHHFQVEHGQRIYDDTDSTYLQIGEHQFDERHVIQLWINLMLVSWSVSRLYYSPLASQSQY